MEDLQHIPGFSIRFLHQATHSKTKSAPIWASTHTHIHTGITEWLHHLTLPLKLLMDPTTILLSRVLETRGSQVPLIRLHEETELVSGSRLLFTSVKLNFSIEHKSNSIYILYYIKPWIPFFQHLWNVWEMS